MCRLDKKITLPATLADELRQKKGEAAKSIARVDGASCDNAGTFGG
jgi:hypothetical protein